MCVTAAAQDAEQAECGDAAEWGNQARQTGLEELVEEVRLLWSNSVVLRATGRMQVVRVEAAAHVAARTKHKGISEASKALNIEHPAGVDRGEWP